MNLKTKSANETKIAGKKLAEKIKKEGSPSVIALQGELGSGKTTFVKGFAEEFNLKEITSPTFVLMKKYKVNGRFDFLYHMDFYRMDENSSLGNIDLEEIMNNPRKIILIEWPKKIAGLPEEALLLEFEFLSEKERIIRSSG